MKNKEILKLIGELLEKPILSGDEVLEEFDIWDSLMTLEVITKVDENFGVLLSDDKLNRVETVSDLAMLISDTIASKK